MSKDAWRRLSIFLFISLVGVLVLLPPWSPLSVTSQATPEGQVLEEVTPSGGFCCKNWRDVGKGLIEVWG